MNIQIPIVLAEVSDKIPPGWGYLLVGLFFLGTVTFCAIRRWFWVMILEFTVIGIGMLMVVKDFVLDVPMRDAILHEQGLTYHLAALTPLVTPILVGTALYIRLGHRTVEPQVRYCQKLWMTGARARRILRCCEGIKFQQRKEYATCDRLRHPRPF